MLLPRSHAWTPVQRWLITTAVVLAIVLFGALVYSYERYDRGPTKSALFGIWRDTTPAMDSVAYGKSATQASTHATKNNGVGFLS
jgi:hypothetical protein